MKKGLKKIAISLIFSFSTVFVFTPSYSFANHLNHSSRGCFSCRTTERWGNGGKWETKDSSASNTLWPIVIGGLGLGVLIYLFKNSGSKPEPQKIYIKPNTKNYPKEDSQEYGKKFNYNPSKASNGVVILNESNENLNNNSENNNEQNDPSLTIGDRF